jgi:hypothetical protein
MLASAKCKEAEQRDVERFLASIIRDAELDADRVAAFLKLQGYTPLPLPKMPIAQESVPTGPAAEVLLNLAAALRLRSWELAGLTSYLPADLPSAVDALAAAAELGSQPQQPATPGDGAIAQYVFRTSIERFSRDGQSCLGTDVLLEQLDSDDLLDDVAAFLWGQRGLLNEITKGEDGT